MNRKVLRSRRRPRGRNTSNGIGRYASDAWSLAKRTAIGLNEIRKFINVEEKYKDVNATSSTTSASGAIDTLLGIAQGTDVSNRVGDSIRCQMLDYKLTCTRNGTDGCVRIIILRDTENQGATPAVTDVLQSVGTAINTVVPYNWFNKNPNAEKNRFVILFDEVICVSSNEPNVHIEAHFPQSEMRHVRFRGTTNGAASFGEGTLFHIAITDQAANQPLVTWYSRLSYTDD